MKTLLVMLLTGIAFAQQPPLYQGTSTSTAPMGTLIPPFNSTSLYNSVIVDPPSGNLMTLLTDGNWKCGNATAATLSNGNLTVSGGANDIMSSKDGTYIAVHVNGDNCILHLGTAASGALQNQTNGGEDGCLAVPGGFGFSKTSDTTFYWVSADHLLHQGTIKNDCQFIETVSNSFPFDYDSCPGTGIGTGTRGNSASILGISFDDRVFTLNISWTGNQGTAHLAMGYIPGVGCSTLNTLTGQWYAYGATAPSGTESGCLTPNALSGQGMHDSQLTGDGAVMVISGGAWNFGADNFCMWQIGTGTAVGLAAAGNGLTGHESVTGRFLIDANNPNPNIRLVSPLSQIGIASYTVLNKLPISPGGPGGYHGAMAHQFGSDLMPWVVQSSGATDGTSFLTPEYLQNEVFGLPSYGSGLPILRFGETFNSGHTGGFSCQNGIGYPLQNGTGWVFLTDSLGNLPICELAILKLVKP